MKESFSTEKLSIEECRKTLNQNGNNYTDEEILKIRDFLYQFVEIEKLVREEEILRAKEARLMQ